MTGGNTFLHDECINAQIIFQENGNQTRSRRFFLNIISHYLVSDHMHRRVSETTKLPVSLQILSEVTGISPPSTSAAKKPKVLLITELR